MKGKCFDCGFKGVFTALWSFTLGVYNCGKLVAKPKQFCPKCTENRQHKIVRKRQIVYGKTTNVVDE